MSPLFANVINETQKIFLKKKTSVFLFLTAIFPIGMAFIFSLLQNKAGVTLFVGANFPLFILGIGVNFLFPLLIFMMASDIFAGEQGDHTLKIVLTRPITRFNVFLSKNVTVGLLLVIHLVLIFVVSVASGFVLGGTDNVLSSLWEEIKAYAVSFAPMLSLSFAAIFFAQFFKSASSALTTTIVIYLCAKVTPFVFPWLGKLLPFTYTDWYSLWLGHTVGMGNILQPFMYLLSYSILFFVGGFYLFDRKEL
ncbi:ABC-2 type transport system permease protein [Aneurinibacillus soli]|uniref:ABC-2 family transporter protein n=1 Tax=Aneurinibacillus soli TaxID=1500254 RepID=A0A0U5C8D2_9BACL|nr:ABC transporter permease [Aneurinibacillus soli]PYE62248.1 ABC-2 type transport system permease protein [Aneurinibacillus soli]BAU28563.1 ABC-2 family transporter protein [Aneurinibacillus soli]